MHTHHLECQLQNSSLNYQAFFRYIVQDKSLSRVISFVSFFFNHIINNRLPMHQFQPKKIKSSTIFSKNLRFTLQNYHRNHKLWKLQLSHSSEISFYNFICKVVRREVFTGKSNYIIQVKNLKKAREIRRPIIWISNEEKALVRMLIGRTKWRYILFIWKC